MDPSLSAFLIIVGVLLVGALVFAATKYYQRKVRHDERLAAERHVAKLFSTNKTSDTGVESEAGQESPQKGYEVFDIFRDDEDGSNLSAKSSGVVTWYDTTFVDHPEVSNSIAEFTSQSKSQSSGWRQSETATSRKSTESAKVDSVQSAESAKFGSLQSPKSAKFGSLQSAESAKEGSYKTADGGLESQDGDSLQTQECGKGALEESDSLYTVVSTENPELPSFPSKIAVVVEESPSDKEEEGPSLSSPKFSAEAKKALDERVNSRVSAVKSGYIGGLGTGYISNPSSPKRASAQKSKAPIPPGSPESAYE